jgi:succinate dehydrogenase / fumarate reductase cytochrome b subunit
METNRDFGFFNRRLHSLLGIMPVGLFLLEHFFTNSFAWHGAAAYNEKIEFFQSLPYLLAIEIAFIFLPLLFHGIYGLYIVWTGKQNVLSYGYARNWMYFIQRVTGVILILFIGWHLWTTRLSNLFFGTEVSYDLIHNLVTSPITFWWMVLGIVSASFHLANGLWSFCIVWGITIGPKAQERMGYLTIGLWLILSFVGVRALYAFV